MAKCNELKGASSFSSPLAICGDSLKGRQQRQPSCAPMKRANQLMELIHSNLTGLRVLVSANLGTFLDDYTRACWVHPLNNRNQALSALKTWRTLLEIQPERKIQRFRTDGGEEYASQECGEYFKRIGVKREPTAPYSPEQNGKSGRSNYSPMAPVRSMLKAKGLPPTLWNEVAKTAACMKNRSPYKEDAVTPYERLNRTQPCSGHLRIIRSRIYMRACFKRNTKKAR